MFLGWLRNRKARTAMNTTRRAVAPRRPTFRPTLEALEGRCLPSTLTVLNNLDSGKGSLRTVIAHAKSNDVIVFAPGLDGQTITLTSGELYITKSLTIQGPGAGQLAVSGNHPVGGNGGSRVFEVAATAQVTLSGVTIRNGDGAGNVVGYDGDGGGILNRGTLTVSNCTVSDNQAFNDGGGIYNIGTLTVNGCTVSDNAALGTASGLGGGLGGGIYNAGTLNVSGCTLSSSSPATGTAQHALDGGGIYNVGTATVSKSTLAVNGALGGYGGGIYNVGTLTVSSCTLSGDIATYGGGGIYNAGTLTVLDSIFSGNSPDNIFGPYADGGGNTFN